ncbi:glutathione S-transferase family protein [Pleionea sp. CnH1-48]|uniref:glutathione S-transferase family protein n=1 Tax=Pleionea sp. CnH1-48 TaxID=2954494 RepID=UPI002097923B|nr:glutathione S-transferase family protein [Pleionea sp. CnH1-48]MCO7223491.1 glutathione S-transferase family protein [Pleionea sp. CnH1-48]
MYTLFYYPCNASLAPHLLLEHMELDYQLTLVDRKENAHKSKEFLQLNPLGRIPALIDDEMVLFESPAICVHLAEKHPEKFMMPGLGTPERAKFHQWLMFLTNTLQAELMVYFYPDKYTTMPEVAPSIREQQHERVAQFLAVLDDALSKQPFLAGERLSACDFYFLMLAIWADEIHQPPMSFPHIKKYLQRITKLPSVIRVCEKEGISLEEYQS